MSKYTPFEISITAIVNKDGKYLITKRSMTKERFPGKWTVPGGHLEPEDYMSYPKDTDECWYNVLEKALAREVMEEVGLEVENVRYLTSLVIDIPVEGTVPSTGISITSEVRYLTFSTSKPTSSITSLARAFSKTLYQHSSVSFG